MKRIMMLLLSCSICLCMVGCTNRSDHVEVCNKSGFVFDNVIVDVKEGYYYSRHERTTIDENTIALTIYFTKNDGWE